MMIGELAKHVGVSIETVRYYERRGLLPPPPRTSGGYRRYEADQVSRLRFIKRARTFSFTLSDIEELLALRTRPGAACDAVDRKTREKIALVNERIRELTALEHTLTRLLRTCDAGKPIEACPILHELETRNTRTGRPIA